MKISNISDKIISKGCIIEPSYQKNLLKLNKNRIIDIFKERGFIIFRNFQIKKELITKFTDLFTIKYANDAMRRTVRFKDKRAHDVDPGIREMPLHSEASYSPSWPEIIWFYCNKAPKNSGSTTISDGQTIYKKFNSSLKKFFLENQIIYDLKVPFGKKNNKSNILKKNFKKPWHIDYPGISDCYLNLKTNEVNFKLKRYAVVKDKYNLNLSFVNHLQIILNRDPQVKKISMNLSDKILKKRIAEVKNISDECIYEIQWQNGDLCMINNQRFMHGRRRIEKNENRDIINIQTLQSNF